LIDPISQEARTGGQPAFEKASFVLEYGMKGAALDLGEGDDPQLLPQHAESRF
jgi:hypothetical protein